MNNTKKISGFIARMPSDKKRFLIILGAIGILLILFSSFSGGEEAIKEDSLQEYKENLESELAELCSSVAGAGKCRVSVTFSEGERIEYKGSNKTSVTPPRVLGVTVICQGADSPSVKAAISDCMTSLFDISSKRVCVLKMK